MYNKNETVLKFSLLLVVCFSLFFTMGLGLSSFSHQHNFKNFQSYVSLQNTISVTYQQEGMRSEKRITPMTVNDFMLSQDIKLPSQYRLNLDNNHMLKDQDFIKITKIEYEEYLLQEKIPFQVVHKKIDQMADGLIAVWIPGEEGRKKVTYQNKYEDGLLISTTILRQNILKNPVTEIIGHGTCIFNGPYKKKMRVLASSYNPTVAQCDESPLIGATGRVRFGMIAVDTKVIPLWTKLYVEGYGYAFAGDTGGLIKGNRIDCFLWRKLKNDNWRGGYINIYILE
ncbi:MAG: 3D domain-containing protein [Sphaerochaetaceae bacterium]|nr:3D domain-containing protein [Sphaerochaetaceae bacterium]